MNQRDLSTADMYIGTFLRGCLIAGVYVWSRLRKLKYATKEAKKEALYGSTLMIDGLPIDITDDEMLFEHLNTVVPSWIKTAHIALDLEALIRIERALAAARHEHARAVNNMGTCLMLPALYIHAGD